MLTETESPTVFSVEMAYPITAELLGEIFVGEFEGNDMTSWLGRVTPINPEGKLRTPGHEGPWYDDEGFIANPAFAFTVNYDTEEDGEGDLSGMTTINHAEIKDGLQTMAEYYPDHWANLVDAEGNRADAITYDVAFQCIVLGSVIYG